MKSYRHRANNALGAVVICGLFAAETAHIATAHPSPATPYIRALLAACAIAAFLLYLHYRRKSKQAGE